MQVLMIVTGIMSLLDTLFLLNLIGSLAALRRLDAFRPAVRSLADWPFISVLIPARNEAATIEACLRSLLAQQYPCVEILVLDDESTDDTAAIVTRLAEQAHGDQGAGSSPTLMAAGARLRLLHGAPLPPGWLGKCHACYQLAAAAQGDYLLFTDADTIHGPTSIASALGAAEHLHVGLLSVLPRQRALTWSEQLLMPLLPLNILALLPVGLVRRRPEASLSAGIGQFLFFRRAAYRSSGGHVAVRDQVLDDVMLARRVKAAGWQIDLLDGSQGVQCRMYSSFAGIWRGFAKNLYDFYGRSPVATMIAVVLRIALFVAPPLLTIVALIARLPLMAILIPLIAYLLAVSMRWLVALRLGTRETSFFASGWWSGLLHPYAEAIHCAITLNSMRWGLRQHMAWKGRTYSALSPPKG